MSSSMKIVLLMLFICILCLQNTNGLGIISSSKKRQYNIKYKKMVGEYMDKCNITLYPIPIIIPSKNLNCEDILQFNDNYVKYRNQNKLKQISMVTKLLTLPITLIIILIGIALLPF